MENIARLLTENVNGATFITIDTVTKMRLNKTNNPHFDRVSKMTFGLNVMVFQNKTTNAYDNMVKRRLTREGKNPQDFQLSPRTWGQRIEGTCFVTHKGKYYVEVICLRSGSSEYFLDHNPINFEDIQGVPAGYRQEAHQGGLDDKVIIRTYAVDNIHSMTINGHKYEELYFDPENI